MDESQKALEPVNSRAQDVAQGSLGSHEAVARSDAYSTFEILGVRVDAVQIPDAVGKLREWIDTPYTKTRYVAVTGMHGVAESRQDRLFRTVLNTADLVVPDGMPLVWFSRVKGFRLRHRVCGADLMDSFCLATGNSYRHFFFGGGPGVAQKLAQCLQNNYGIVVAGTYTPPFRPMTETEERELAHLVEQSAPDVFWVGLSTPKQELWMFQERHRLKVPVMLGVGAAFDMNSGGMKRAPKWMRDVGLEWFFRLISEPRRLWRRYLLTIPKAALLVGLQILEFSSSSTKAGEKHNG